MSERILTGSDSINPRRKSHLETTTFTTIFLPIWILFFFLTTHLLFMSQLPYCHRGFTCIFV